jgi:ATP-dependent helicase HrpA
MTFRVTDGDRELARGKDLDALRRELRPRLAEMVTEAAGDLIRTGLKDWSIGTLPRVFTRGQLTAYPALEDAGGTAEVRLFETQAQASAAMVRGTRRLLLLRLPTGLRSIAGRLPNERKLALSRSPYPGIGALLDDCEACAADQVIADCGGPAWDADGFARLLAAARPALPLATSRVLDITGQVLEAAHAAESRLHANNPALAPALADARAQFAALIYPGFVSETGLARLPDLVRYLRAVSRRLDTAAQEPARDAERMAAVHRVTTAYSGAVAELAPARRADADVQAVRWMIEELRVSLFAQVLGTSGPVSEKRILAALDRLAGTP